MVKKKNAKKRKQLKAYRDKRKSLERAIEKEEKVEKLSFDSDTSSITEI